MRPCSSLYTHSTIVLCEIYAHKMTWQIESYNKLESVLKETVEATELKQKQLLSKEVEVCMNLCAYVQLHI